MLFLVVKEAGLMPHCDKPYSKGSPILFSWYFRDVEKVTWELWFPWEQNPSQNGYSEHIPLQNYYTMMWVTLLPTLPSQSPLLFLLASFGQTLRIMMKHISRQPCCSWAPHCRSSPDFVGNSNLSCLIPSKGISQSVLNWNSLFFWPFSCFHLVTLTQKHLFPTRAIMSGLNTTCYSREVEKSWSRRFCFQHT